MADQFLLVDTKGELKKLRTQLKGLSKKIESEDVLIKAINSAANRAKKDLVKGMQKVYALQDETALSSTKEGKPRVKRATFADLVATIISKGPMLGIRRYTVSENTKTEAAKAKVKASSAMKALEVNGKKAFAVTLKNGHRAIMERAGKARLPIQEIMAPALPIAFGNAEVQEPVQQEIQSVLQNAIQQQITKVLKQG